MVQQLANEPDARSLEVLDLNPYTFYRWACMHYPDPSLLPLVACDPHSISLLLPITLHWPAIEWLKKNNLASSQVSHASGQHCGHQSSQSALQKDPDTAGPSRHLPRKCYPAYSQWDQPVAPLGGKMACFTPHWFNLSSSFCTHFCIVMCLREHKVF